MYFSIISENAKDHFIFSCNLKTLNQWLFTTAQLHSTNPQLRFCTGSNLARGVSEIEDDEDFLTMAPARNKAKQHLSLVNYITKTAHQRKQNNSKLDVLK